MKEYRKKQPSVKAIKFDGKNMKECLSLCPNAVNATLSKAAIVVFGIEGDVLCSIGDWIVQGPGGEFYVRKSGEFERDYEPVENKEGE